MAQTRKLGPGVPDTRDGLKISYLSKMRRITFRFCPARQFSKTGTFDGIPTACRDAKILGALGQAADPTPCFREVTGVSSDMLIRQIRFILAAVLAIGRLISAGTATAQTFAFSNSFQGWQPVWYLAPGYIGVVPGQVSLDSQLGFGDSSSLKFNMGSGTADDGTLWIERAFPAVAGISTQTALSFALYSPSQSDFNQFQVVAYVGSAKPTMESNFTVIGYTDSRAGWQSYLYQSTNQPTADTLWVALGINIVYEASRTYWIDQVGVSITPPPPVTVGDFNGDRTVNAADIAPAMKALTDLTGYETQYSVSPASLPLIDDVNGDGQFNSADLQYLLNTLKSGGGSTYVPEPSTFVLTVVAFGMLWWRFSKVFGREQQGLAPSPCVIT